jgi:hypothetical protein
MLAGKFLKEIDLKAKKFGIQARKLCNKIK